MTESQRLTIRSSEIRSRLNEIAGLDDSAISDQIKSETEQLNNEYQAVETKLRAAIASETEQTNSVPTDDSESRELRSIQGRARLGRYLTAFSSGTILDGAEKELCEARSLTATGNVVPWDALLPQTTTTEAELRADVVTVAPSSNTAVNVHQIMPRVFARSAIVRLGVSMPSVPAGTSSWPFITMGQSPSFVAAGTAKEAIAGTIATYTATPHRLQARFAFRLEDAATIDGLEEALRDDLRSSMSDQIDRQLVGAGDAQVRGFLATSAQGGITDYADPTSTVTFTTAATQVARGIDGLYASSVGECSWVCGVQTMTTLEGLFTADGSTSASERMTRRLSGFSASAHIPAPASNIQQGILSKNGGPAQTAVAPIWQGMRLIRDEVSAATTGQIAVTAVMLMDFRILRHDAYVRTKLKLA